MFDIIRVCADFINIVSGLLTQVINGSASLMGKVEPMEQFVVKRLWNWKVAGFDLSITNSAVVMLSSVVIIMVLYMLMSWRKSSYQDMATRPQAVLEVLYQFINNMLIVSIGESENKARPVYTNFIFSIFLFVLVVNLLGLAPFAFSPTSHIIVTFTLAALVFTVITIAAIAKYGLYFFRIFVPSGIPLWMVPLMLVLELFGYLAKPISLSIRLAANMLAGHVMLEVLAFFVVAMGIFGIFPMFFLIAVLCLELFVSVLQAYIFALLSSIYIGEVLRH